jgi:hypothetical protein
MRAIATASRQSAPPLRNNKEPQRAECAKNTQPRTGLLMGRLGKDGSPRQSRHFVRGVIGFAAPLETSGSGVSDPVAARR